MTTSTRNSDASALDRSTSQPGTAPQPTRVGVVGLGRMGSAFARNLLDDGYETVIFSKCGKNVAALEAAGAKAAMKWIDLAHCEIVISMVPDDEATDSVSISLANVLDTHAIHISMSTISPDASHRASERHSRLGQGYVAAPVLGNPDLAAARKLYILAAGPDEHVERSLPLLDRLGQRIFNVGQNPELANTFKLAGNALTAATLQSMGEVLAFLHKAGVDPKVAFSVFTESLFDGKVHKAYGRKIVEQRYSPPGMTLPLAVKDLRLALAEAEQLSVPMPVASVVRDRLVAAVARGWEDLDWSALGKLAEFSAGI
ncbi:NAD(P)-dependent oxidoreductase [Paraburkholderia sp. 40]|uniref:NAD(P)-dependent oxidoreductase n=1 Tax=Paraburkholderia sp. 40 TaxID=2991059 RepID=UPI003D203F07